MTEKIDLLIHSASQLLTLASPDGPQRGVALGDLGLIEDGAVAVRDGQVVMTGPTTTLRAQVEAAQELNADGQVVMPGFVDPHTHVVFAGQRADEFAQRIAGATYMEIMAAGGGIMSTVRATRQATIDDLVSQTLPRLDAMLTHGSTTVEAKTGYGLNVADELKMLAAIRRLDALHPIDLVPTFLGAHAIPAEYQGQADTFTDLVVHEMLPAFAAHLNKTPLLFCDVFCEDGAFSLAQSRRVLERARELGFRLKIHADEFKPLGGTALAVELGAVSVDHLVCTPADEIKALACSQTIAVALPGTPFGLAHQQYTPARAIIEAGGSVALASDLNPGTCYCESMQFMMALACRYMRLTPAEAIAAATINSAHAVGMGESVGSLEPGKQADILVLNVPDYQSLGYRFGSNLVDKVIKRGRIVVPQVRAETAAQ
jgi:imidazolonepropionase